MARETVRIGAATVIHGDCLQMVPSIGPVDAIVTDPPYHLTGVRGGGANAVNPANRGQTSSPFAARAGFMGKAWDGGDIAFRPETWAAMLPALKPGGYLLAFGGARTHHRMWCAIEDAGFVIQDTISWLYGQGFPKGRTQLKPAWEPVVVAYKPGGKRVLQIDECRVPCADKKTPFPVGATSCDGSIKTGLHSKPRQDDSNAMARWPANLCHDGSDEVLQAFAVFGESQSNKRTPTGRRDGEGNGGFVLARTDTETRGHIDVGTAARFFYCAKANRHDRCGSKHPTVKPIAVMRWLVRLVTPPGGTVLDPFAGSGTTAAAALAEGRQAILIEREPEYFEDIKRRLRADQRRVAKAA